MATYKTALEPTQVQRIVGLLQKVSFFDHERDRKGVLIGAFDPNHAIVGQVDWGGARDTFLLRLIHELYTYGDDALPTLLNYSKNYVGFEDISAIDMLVGELFGGTITVVQPASSFNARLQTLAAPGGPVAFDSDYLIRREQTQADILTELRRRRGLVTVRAPRQSGKSTLIATILSEMRTANEMRPIVLDFQTIPLPDLSTEKMLWREIAELIAYQVGLPDTWRDGWQNDGVSLINLDKLVRLVFDVDNRPLLLCWDEVERLFGTGYHQVVFPLIRGLHGSGAQSEHGGKVRWLFGTSSDPAFFIKGAYESPFNIGQRNTVPPFTIMQVGELAMKHGANDPTLPPRLHEYLGGRPYLTHLFLHEFALGKAEAELFNPIKAGGGVFFEHLHRFEREFKADAPLRQAMCCILRDIPCKDTLNLRRIEDAGLADCVDRAGGRFTLSCTLYRDYFRGTLNC